MALSNARVAQPQVSMKFEVEAPIRPWGGQFLPKDISDVFPCKVVKSVKNVTKGTASVTIEIEGEHYIVSMTDFPTVEANGKVGLEKEEYMITIENGRIIDAK